jgi:predicted RNA binding protein YcfA (HicA-like mRNA interferase family)
VKYRDVIKVIESHGWYLHRMGAGGHMIYRYPTRAGSVVAGGGKLNRNVPTGTFNAILRQAGAK